MEMDHLQVAAVMVVVMVVITCSVEAQIEFELGPFNSSDYSSLNVISPATISNGALQVTPDSAGNYSLYNRSGRVLYNQPFKFWDWEDVGGLKVASFNTSFLINIFRLDYATPGDGLAFVIVPDTNLPPSSMGEYLGLTNSTTDGNSNNHLFALEFDTDSNHLGLNINSVRSLKTVPLNPLGIQLAPLTPTNYTVWVQYDGVSMVLKVYMTAQGKRESKPTTPLLTQSNLNLSAIVKQESYMGFAASTGSNATQLNCVLQWNLTLDALTQPNHSSNHTSKRLVIITAGVVGLLVLLLLFICSVYYVRKKQQKNKNSPSSNVYIMGKLKSLPGSPREFRYKELKKATNNFDEKLRLGQGGFGVVYRGVLPSSEADEVAVKLFSRGNLKATDDFLSELFIINRLRHKHLVRLLGWCHKKGNLLLVYEYMPNGSLDSHLFCGGNPLSWRVRYNIISGVASALHYLHNEYDQRVVHRDLKASNIMLDSNYNARLGDFGLARALDNEKTSYMEQEGVPGTMGYLAPECLHTGKATRESDIYGFGAVVLEVVCGQRPWTKIGNFHLLVDWVWSLYGEGRLLEAVDKGLVSNEYMVEEEAKRLLLLGLACSHPTAIERPKTQAIVQILSGSVGVPYVPPCKPPFIWPSMGPIEGISTTMTTMDMSMEITPLTSSNFGSQHLSGGHRSESSLV